ncbi:RE1-silencing transcription factor-like [Diretmus argenteus]
MAAQTIFSVGMFPVGVSIMEDPQSLSDLPRNNLPAPQLVMLANVAAAESGGGCESSVADEKEMMELKTVGCSYSDSEDESTIIRSVASLYDNQNHREVCIIEYPESPILAVVVGSNARADEEDDGDDNAEDLSQPPEPRPSTSTQMPKPGVKRKLTHTMVVETAKKKKPFYCKPCNYQAQNEEEFVEHLSTHAISKMMVVNRVEGRSKAKEAGASGTQTPEGGAAEGDDGEAGDSKGVIRCERCGYNTNRYDHYIAHLKHHSKEGEDHRVFKCTLCPYTTVSQYHWRKHLRNHFPSKLHTCDQCCYFSDRKSNYIQHIRTHTGVRPFQCAYCDYSSSQKTHLTRHMRTHSGERPFKCESCNYLAANQHEVTRHARQVHNGPKPLACPYCQYKTADRSNFKKHVELHLNPRQFLCPLCKYAASKKCNLQYHIKSRHSGCDIAMDVSKVRLRIKKAGTETGGENDDSSMSKFDESSNFEDDVDDMEDDEGPECIDKESSPINLSIKKSSKQRSVEREVFNKSQKKSEVTPDKEKPQKVRDKVEKKLMTRQKKIEKVSENTKENATVKDSPTETIAPVTTENRVKWRVKKQPAEKIIARDQAEKTQPSGKASVEKDQIETKRCHQEKSEVERAARGEKEKEKQEVKERLEKEKEQLKKKSLNTPRKTGSKKSQKVTEQVEEAPQRLNALKKTQEDKVGKTKAVKRKGAEAFDLSTKPSPGDKCATKAKRLKAETAAKRKSKPSSSEDVGKTVEPRPSPQKDSQASDRAPAPVKQKIRNANRKTTDLQETVSDKTGSVRDNALSSVQNTESLIAERREAPAQQNDPEQETSVEQDPSEKHLAHQNAPTDEMTPPMPEKTSDKTTEKTTLSPSHSSGEETPSPMEDCPPPTFRQPLAKPTSPSLELPGQHGKSADPEDDEGIHSSHEGGSDISDSASEGSDDSGLNGTGAGSGKMANDPETPTDEIPTPTELKSHMCIFCDRTFPLEVEYRRHLNRHLVNVYYMYNTGQK